MPVDRTALTERLADVLYDAGDDSRPHDGRSSFGSGDIIGWECQACGAWINELTHEGPEECPIDWRRPLHMPRYIKAATALLDVLGPYLDVVDAAIAETEAEQ
jgi:hypothetical protein